MIDNFYRYLSYFDFYKLTVIINFQGMKMAIPRKYLVDSETPGFYHCISRCVRRAFLCGEDLETGKNYDHRKVWLEKRMLELASIFSVELYAYAIMDNHYHLVLYLDPIAPLNWTDSEIAEKWLLTYPGRLDAPGFELQRELKKQAIMADKKKLQKYRQRFGSLSWFMSRLNEPLAKTSNAEDSVSGRFWESRYTSVALLDESAVLSCMAYVDLNPIRAGVVQELQASLYTSISKRLKNLSRKPELLTSPISSVAGCVNGRVVNIQLKNYVELVEWAGKSIVHPNKAKMPAHIKTLLTSMNLQSDNWLTQIKNFNKGSPHSIGCLAKLQDKAEALKKKWIKGVSASRKYYLRA